ncbi:putative short chain dehydrogenase [Conidiobolus coronatus NRRL 28638]|uniref:Putative short chain dehydrogenase n=1 Tax=Conidiobolus coronatus (strain ATCC 28846 / CBS 209.66 / NRRL 28638) TaxID=796925 RepID=A0A137NQK5_CONC2|nr:putative short chain dehydrogenase [Conidiobolus coronatus NRRL 28638]|eukprot:KXN65045.1 putative short chain dehydrogenase [Conidiobolus coronatus NRRL 28638]
MNLQNKVAFITGSSKNMGRAFAEELAKQGAKLVVHYHSDKSRAAAEEVAALASGSIIVQGDLSKVDVIKGIFKQIIDKFGGVDIVINNAGEVLKKPFTDISEEEYDRVFGINAKSAFFVMQEAAKCINDNGRIINMGTSLLAVTTPFYSAYAGSKAPLEHFTRALAKELGHRGITVNTVAPGPIDTSFFYGQETDESVAMFTEMTPAKRLGLVNDIVPVINFLVSENARWVSGQTVFVNGALIAR